MEQNKTKLDESIATILQKWIFWIVPVSMRNWEEEGEDLINIDPKRKPGDGGHKMHDIVHYEIFFLFTR